MYLVLRQFYAPITLSRLVLRTGPDYTYRFKCIDMFTRSHDLQRKSQRILFKMYLHTDLHKLKLPLRRFYSFHTLEAFSSLEIDENIEL